MHVCGPPVVTGFQPVALILKFALPKQPAGPFEQSLIKSSSRLRYLAITIDLVYGMLPESWWVRRL